MKRNVSNFPPIQKRMWEIIEKNYNGNVCYLTKQMGIDNSAKINRLFVEDKSGGYPLPTTDVLINFINTTNTSADWILFGKRNDNDKHVNNIAIDGDTNVSGENNVVASSMRDHTSSGSNGSDLMKIIAMQQEQINSLTKIIAVNNNGKH